MNARLRSDELVLQRDGVVEQVEFACRADVEDVKLRVQFGGQLHSFGRAFVARFGAPDDGVLADGNVLSKALFGACRIGTHSGFVLAVRGDKGGRLFEDALEHSRFIHEHVARG